MFFCCLLGERIARPYEGLSTQPRGNASGYAEKPADQISSRTSGTSAQPPMAFAHHDQSPDLVQRRSA